MWFLRATKNVIPFTAKSGHSQNSTKFPNFILYSSEKQMLPGKRTDKEVSFNGNTAGFFPQTQKLELHTK